MADETEEPEDGGERPWRSRLPDSDGEWLYLASRALIVVGPIGLVGSLWLALRSQGVIGGEVGISGPDITQRIDFLASTLDRLVLPTIAIALGPVLDCWRPTD